MALKR